MSDSDEMSDSEWFSKRLKELKNDPKFLHENIELLEGEYQVMAKKIKELENKLSKFNELKRPGISLCCINTSTEIEESAEAMCLEFLDSNV